jgi:hypothetical protein
MDHLTTHELEQGMAEILKSPKDNGSLEMIVRRPSRGEREVLTEAGLNTDEGLAGDCWKTRGSSRTKDKKADPNQQVTLMNARVIALIAGERDRWPLAGDQLFVDLDLSDDNTPPGTQLAIGDALIEITNVPHTGCHKFIDHFGVDAAKFVNTYGGKNLHLRGRNARVIRSGKIRTGDPLRKNEHAE